jgi:predicted  nucleic acid-binding Zn-ribbon protein
MEQQKKTCHWCGAVIDEAKTYWHLTQQGGFYLCDKCGWNNWKSFKEEEKEDNEDLGGDV